MTLSETLADYVTGTSYDDLPAPVIARAKELVLDTLAVAWAGTESSGSDDMCAMVTEEGGRADATIWGFGARAPAAGAAFVNGVTAAALDYDSLHLAAMGHAAIVVLPTPGFEGRKLNIRSVAFNCTGLRSRISFTRTSESYTSCRWKGREMNSRIPLRITSSSVCGSIARPIAIT